MVFLVVSQRLFCIRINFIELPKPWPSLKSEPILEINQFGRANVLEILSRHVRFHQKVTDLRRIFIALCWNVSAGGQCPDPAC